MKYSNYLGVIAAIILIGCCFLPWVYIDAIKTTITGLSAEHTHFGRPGILHIFFSIVSILLFIIPATWAKSTNVFIVTFNLAWSVRNFLLIPQCELGECPQKLFGMYAILVVSVLMLVMAMMPRLKVRS